ncbi:hypothetical protein [Formosa sp. PL04]|uniref:hypothetical protein n=1 Tax=Formosa sp. PL04 TaxID=3081755 RepID=UPI002981910B|nr:hypothetical protein [Formosa sp. PL04]MDW5289679.1 hypothetical protein [Formosa sp. PL04]
MRSNFLKFIGLVVFVSYSLFAAQTLEVKKTDKNYEVVNDVFSGTWNWENNNDTSSFDLILEQNSNVVQGSQCAIAQSGRKIDCSEEGDYSIVGTINNDVATVSYKTSYSSTEGSAELKILPNGNLEWKIINKASGQSFLPSTAILIKN